MNTGKQFAALLLISTALTVPGAAFAQDTASQTDTSDPMLDDVEGVGEDEDYSAPDISVGGGDTIIVTGRINRDPTRNSTQVISVLSTEEISRTGEGDIAGALGRVTGLSVVGNGRVYVRGLGDRYSLAMLNGLPLPSPEPLSRVVPLDIFPTNVVASSLVQKTYSANFPGEFGGGVINLTTRAVPDESFLTISGGFSGDTETTFQNGYTYFGSGTDWTGFDNGARNIPGRLETYFADSIATGASIGSAPEYDPEFLGRVLTPPQMATLQTIGDQRPNWSAGITAGTAFDIGDDARLGLVVTGSLNNSLRNRDITRRSGGDSVTQFSRDEQSFVTDNRVLANALFSAGLEAGDHVFRFTTLFIRDTVKQASLTDFKIFDGDLDDVDFLEQNTAWYERQLIDSQFVGELDFGGLGVDFRGGYARTDRRAPFNLNYVYARTNLPLANDPFGDVYRVDLSGSGQQALQETEVVSSFSDLQEELWFGGVDISYELLDNLNVTVGYSYTDTQRETERRAFQLRASVDPDFHNPTGDPSIPDLSPEIIAELDTVLAAAGTRSPWLLFNGATFNMFDVTLQEFGSTTPAFDASLTIHGGYGQFQWIPVDALNIQAGVRFETAEQASIPRGANNQAISRVNKNDYWLPGVTVTWEATDDLQIRANGSKTIARPQFRELVSQIYFDPETNRTYVGNTFLNDSELLNFELRGEYYLSRQDKVSLAGFFKEIDNPIEAFRTGAGDITYANAPKAQLYGAEFDAQFYVDLYNLGGWFESKQLLVLANYTYTQSELAVGNETIILDQGGNPVSREANTIFVDGSSLVGQSDHLINFQLGLEDLDKLQQATILVSYASDRVTFRNLAPLPDTIERPGVQLDLVLRQGFELAGTEAEIKLQARNLLGTRNQEFLINSTGLRIDSNTYDIGQSFSASLSITF